MLVSKMLNFSPNCNAQYKDSIAMKRIKQHKEKYEHSLCMPTYRQLYNNKNKLFLMLQGSVQCFSISACAESWRALL
jgi:hypothetical protein